MKKNKKSEKKTNYQQILSYIWKSYRLFPKNGIIALFARILSTGVAVVPPLFYKQIIDTLSQTGVATNELVAHATGILIVVFGIQLWSWVVFRIYDYTAINFEMDIQEKLNNTFLKYLQKHSFQFFSDNFTGSLISKFRKGVAAFERITDILAREIIPFIVNITLILGIIGSQSREIAVGMLIIVIIFSIIQYKLYLYIYPYQEKANALDSALGGLLSDIITNSITIKTFASEEREEKSYGKLNHITAQARKTQYYKSIRIRGSTGLFSILLQTGVVYTAIIMRGKGLASLGMIILLQTYAIRIMDFLRGMGHTFRNIFRATSEAGEIIEILETPHEVVDKSNKKLKVSSGEIRFKDVNFSYGEHQIFNNLNLSIKPWERVALVWESGSGKTTITKLLQRFYDIHSGEILIDNQNIAEVSQDSLRTEISMIPQDPILFHRSIKENIAYGKPNASEQEIIAVAKMARCHNFIMNFENGYDALVGERGIKLSWGERQRIAIARAILENKQIIIMDEATSALDSESEMLVQEAMEEVMKNKTVLIIAHRLSTIIKMDKIIVMHNGKIIEKGSHQELLTNENWRYKKLREIQSGGFL